VTRPFIGYGRQTIDDSDIAAVVDVLKADLLTQGPVIERFEESFAASVNARHAIAVSNGTAALHLACLAAGLSDGDCAIVPDMTFVATANAPLYCGARTLLTDIDPDSLGLQTGRVIGLVKERPDVKAVLPVHFAGLAVDMPTLASIREDAVIIEDGCHALGGTYEDGSPIGGCSYSHMTVFSFHPVKPITTAEGGIVTTNADDLAGKLRALRSHGIERNPESFVQADGGEARPWYYEQQFLGFNYRMTELQAALGLNQLPKLPGFLERRRRIAAFYDDRFRTLAHVALPQSRPDQRARSGMHLYLLDIDFKKRNMQRGAFMQSLRDVGIGTQVHYIPVHRQPYHQRLLGGGDFEFPNAERHYQTTLSIPLFPSMSDAEVEYVAQQIIARLQ
tara:strand:+ start:15714 stop:16889 length:1176 start_codon:yes stop_codon:yes gene_type:complete